VVKHEARAIRAARRRIVGPAEVALDGTEARELEPAAERALDANRWAAPLSPWPASSPTRSAPRGRSESRLAVIVTVT
jgi:hypothetical protein